MNNFFLEIPSDASQLITVEEFVHYAAVELHLSEEMQGEMLLLITEATTNAIRHANKYSPEKTVQISISREADLVTVTVKDQGEGFDPEAIPDPTIPENILKDHGRGLFLMRTIAKEVRFDMTAEGTLITLVLQVK